MTIIDSYLSEISAQLATGHAREHSYRPALERLMMSFDKVHAVNEPKHSEHGAPDFVFLSNNNNDLILGYAEAKDIGVSLDKTEKTDQMTRYGGYANLFLTDYLEFRFFRNGEKYETISIGHIENGKLFKIPENEERLIRELAAFLEQTPEKIRSGKRLAQIMGAKARRIRNNVEAYLKDGSERSAELVKIYDMMKKMLVHDLSEEKFADMYAQTLVYGLFVARYGDKTPNTFSRSEARDLVPKSNPFLRHFFDHIVGPDFDLRLGYIVDELCEIFLVSNVNEIVHKHLRIADNSSDIKDPIIHFYEDFLHEYDPAERKKMGAYYTPIPVVQFIVRNVDRILKEDFNIVKGLASDETIEHEVVTQPWRKKGERKDRLTKIVKMPRVQVLDPAVGTATFLNETIKYIYKSFIGQEGRWASYVNDNLLQRLYGFELMMAPYTIAHLKLGMTLQETGVDSLRERLNVFLTNTLEEGIPQQSDLFSFGLAEAVSEESRLAAEIKSEHPVMIVMGNPPYSVSSNNKGKWIQDLIAVYKKDLNERKINLDDDYIKFIRFAEDMVAKNGRGILAMITNNSYIDGLTHRQMRRHLLDTFDKIYVLDLHGSSMKQERAPDGSKDENVFDIMQGVSIILAVKTNDRSSDLGKVYHAEIYGRRKNKFEFLSGENTHFNELSARAPNYFFTPKDFGEEEKYNQFIAIDKLMPNYNSGIQTKRDKLVYCFDSSQIHDVVDSFAELSEIEIREKYDLPEDGRDWSVADAKDDIKKSSGKFTQVVYHPFDKRDTWYSAKTKGIMAYPRSPLMRNMLQENLALISIRNSRRGNPNCHFVSDTLIDKDAISPFDNSRFFPLWIYHDDGTRTANFNTTELSIFTHNLNLTPSPQDVLDYIYASLYSPSYRLNFKEFLTIDFPHIPVPNNDTEFNRLLNLGHQLRELHLMKSSLLEPYGTTYPEEGSDEVERIYYENSKVWINEQQYFGNVPEKAWNFYIGGYQPAQKWLKDRAFSKINRALTNQDLDHYQKIIKILLETDRIMKEIG